MLDTSLFRDLSYAVNRRIISPKGRKFVSKAIAAVRPKADLMTESGLTKSGFNHMGSVLTRQQIEEVAASLGNGPLHDPYKKGSAPFTLDNVPETGIHLGQYPQTSLLRAPHLLQLANRPDILAMAAAMIGGKPTIHNLLSWWSFPVPGAPVDSQLWHRDCADWKMAKLFVYMTDVDDTAGPHVYAPGTVDRPEFQDVRRYSDAEVLAKFPNTVTITGNAGDAFMEDARGLHRATLPTGKRRWIFEVSYGLMGLPPRTYDSYEKIKIKRSELNGIDPWINRLFVDVV